MIDPADQFLFRRPHSHPLKAGKDHPNILWIVAAELSPEIGCYGDAEARTPHLDRLASEGLRFDQAHAPAGTAAVARSGLFTGLYPVSLGSQNEPSRIVPPHEVRHVGELFRAAGYYCTHRGASDLPFENPATAWDRHGLEHADWRERAQATQPFFAVVELANPEPATAEEGPPGTANRHRTAELDRQVGELLGRLAEDGLVEHTLVVFVSVSGRGLADAAAGLREDATRVPLIVRWPAMPLGGGFREDLVSLLDLPPTMLIAAGLPVPKSLQGNPALQGRRLFGDPPPAEPAYLFFHRDRVDRAFAVQRAARDRRWKYLRNYEPSQPSEELYDCQRDPGEAENVAALPQYAGRLARMRQATEEWQQEVGDRGMVPEAVLMHEQRPGGRFPRTAAPVIHRRGSTVLIYCTTDGAAILYRTRSGGEWSRWRLYVDGLRLEEAERVEAKAARIGFRESEIVQN